MAMEQEIVASGQTIRDLDLDALESCWDSAKERCS
jgi:hypothetical protein